MLRVAIVGVSGYTGGELLRLLLHHPQVQITHVTSESAAGQPVASIHRNLRGRCALVCERLRVGALARDTELTFLALPHGASGRLVAELLQRGLRIIDLSADFRLKDPKQYQRWYNTAHPVPHLLKRAVYGLPELYREAIADATLVANPGCYATAAILAAWPLAQHRLLGSGAVVIDAKSGVSGAGKKLELRYHYAEANENLLPYAVAGHRHLPEIEQALKRNRKNPIVFVPHLVPMTRGLLVTLYAPLARRISAAQLHRCYETTYHGEPFVAVLPLGQFPETLAVTSTNHCHIGIHVDPKTRHAVVTAALDNLVKGAGGTAIQNMNLMGGYAETLGLI
ncbi:MAG: N-acetyl-gamma-glutamyl-phosphate reductase [Elusimicrobia bacterium]|nr:N-acetyl-gamma-glutamyl-phosphate reductase [Elusimicrobiota bacterium]